MPCECGAKARFVSYRTKTVLTTVGTVEVCRAYYHCSACGTGQVPYDRQSGLGRGQLSNRLAGSVSLLASQVSFDQSRQMVGELLGLRIDENTIALTAQHAGAAVLAQHDRGVAEALESRRPPEPQVRPSRLYVSADGVIAPTRDGWREVKCGLVYWEDPVEGHQSRYLGRIESHEPFGPQLWHLACQCGLRQAAEVVVLGDGAPWIWKLAKMRFARARQILDWYHASEHVWACAHDLYGEGTAAAKRWAGRMTTVLHDQGGRTLQQRLQRSCRGRANVPESLLGLIGYVGANVERMDYPAYRAAGLSIGSGPVESACKRLVAGRLKGPGMRWSVDGANAILALRATWLNGQWTTLWTTKPLAA